MIRGLYTSASGMLKGQKKMDIVSNNLANSATTGYKKDIGISQSFKEMLTKRMNDTKNGQPNNADIGEMSLGSDIVQVFTDYSQGTLVKTDSDTDVGIKNSTSAFFAVNVPYQGEDTEMYTRHGSWTISNDGYLVTGENYEVLGLDGSIYIGTDNFIIQEDGSIYADNQYIDTLKVVDFENTDELTKYGENLVQAEDSAQTQPFQGQLVQGFIEGSNVNTVEEMVEMINIMRAYEANQKIVKAYDDTLDRVINDVGKV